MDPSNAILADYLDRDAAAKQLGRTRRTLERWEAEGIGPPVTRIGRQSLYYIASLRDWLRSKEKPMVRERRRRA